MAYESGVVCAVAGMEFHHGIVVNKVKQALRATDKAGNDPVGVNLLEVVRDNACFHLVNHPIGEHFRMDANVALVVQTGEDSVWYVSNSHL